MKKWCWLLVFFSSVCFAAQDLYSFKNEKDQERFNQLTHELRCLVCQNQTVADSNASLAQDLRDQVYQKIEAGQSNQEIADYLVARYGNFILYKPPLDGATLGLWLIPFLFLGAGLFYLFKNRSQN